MVKIFYLTQYDLQPYYPVQIKSSDNSPFDLTGATIRCNMKTRKGNILKINRESTGINVSDAPNGKFEYRWGTANVDTVGEYNIEFEITPFSGGKFTVPNPKDGKAQVNIISGLDTV